ncbi:uncharacterized protein GIQ15_01212 [Arthroderma uncinatum]|uniref:uncharacterized protein n=1 Tax=Arthroderma uncinatum TaxID=74035 RepID=UPI00144ABE67|nr:uncharacterized protein GIQ15_01212 [Arthroderma uncinatum]KAF3491695.1 hypothetical protein GIQ15_01212 [Arthroderma uncinatum]
MTSYIRTQPAAALKEIKKVIGVYDYLNKESVKEDMATVANRVRDQLEITQVNFNRESGRVPIDMTWFWDRFIRDHLEIIVKASKSFTDMWIKEMRKKWTGSDRPKEEIKVVLEMLGRLAVAAKDRIDIPTTGLTPHQG